MKKKKDSKKDNAKNKKIIVISSILILFLIGICCYFFFPRVERVAIDVDECDDGELGITEGEQYKLDYSLFGINTNVFKANWESDNGNVAVVDSNGTITAITPGNTNISLEAGGKKSSILVKVEKKKDDISQAKGKNNYTVRYNGKAIMEHLFINSNSSKKLEVYYGKNKVGSGVSWSVKDSSLVSVSNGVVKAGSKTGPTTLTVTVKGTKLVVPVVVEKANTSNIYFLDTQNVEDPNNMAILIKSKNGKFGMLDTSHHNTMCSRIINYLSDLGVNKLDYIILSHMHGDHHGCYNSIISKVKVDNLYIKKYNGINSKRQSLFNTIISNSKSKGTKINYVNTGINSIQSGEMTLYLGNTDIIYSGSRKEIVLKKGALSSENAESIVVLLKIPGTKRTSYNYLPADAENAGGLPTRSKAVTNYYTKHGISLNGVKRQKLVKINGQKIKYPFGEGRTYTKANNIKWSAEDRAACWARNIVAADKGIATISCAHDTIVSTRKSINNNVLNIKNRLDIDVYQITHHGRNSSLSTFSFLNPTYAIAMNNKPFPETKYTDDERKMGEAGKETVKKLIYAAKINQNNIYNSGSGTKIFAVDSTGVGTFIKMNNDD